MGGCGKGRKQGGASRKGNRRGRERVRLRVSRERETPIASHKPTNLRQRDPLREKDIDLSHRERESKALI